MAGVLQGFDSDFYVQKKLLALQADSKTAAEWAGKGAADVKALLQDEVQAFLGDTDSHTPEEHFQYIGFGDDALAPNAYFDNVALEKSWANASGKSVNDFDALRGSQGHYMYYLYHSRDLGVDVNPSTGEKGFDTEDYIKAAIKSDSRFADYSVDEVRDYIYSLGFTPLTYWLEQGSNGAAGTKVYNPGGSTDPNKPDEDDVEFAMHKLTEEIDILNGTDADDTYISDSNTASEADTIAGKGGNDTFKLYVQAGDGDSNRGLPSLASIENIYINNDDGGGRDFSDILALENITFEKGKPGDVVLGSKQSLMLKDLNGSVANQVSVTYNAEDEAATLGLEDVLAQVSFKESKKVKTLTLDVAGDNTDDEGESYVDLDTLTAGRLNKVVVTGEGSVKFDTVEKKGITIDASANKGSDDGEGVTASSEEANVTFIGSEGDDEFAAVKGEIKFKGNAGDDHVIMAVAQTDFTTKDVLDGGTGFDTVSVQQIKTNDAAYGELLKAVNAVKEFEALGVNRGENFIDWDALTSLHSVLAENANGAPTAITKIDLKNATSAGSIQVEAGVAVTDLLVQNKIGEDNFAITLNTDYGDVENKVTSKITNLTLDGVNKILIHSEKVDEDASLGNKIENVVKFEGNSNFTLDGDSGLTLSLKGATIDGADAAEQDAGKAIGAVLDASAMKAGVTLTGSKGIDKIIGSAQGDTINGGGGFDVIRGEGGKDTFVFENVQVGGYASIEDFESGEKIRLADYATKTIHKIDAVDDIVEKGTGAGAANEVKFFATGGNTYLIAGDATAAANDHAVVKITGTYDLDGVEIAANGDITLGA